MRLVGEVDIHRTDFLQPRGKASVRHRQGLEWTVGQASAFEKRGKGFVSALATGLSNGWGHCVLSSASVTSHANHMGVILIL